MDVNAIFRAAVTMAVRAHDGQCRSGGDGKTPYVVHPLRVVSRVEEIHAHCKKVLTHTESKGLFDLNVARVVAVLHDTLEDTSLTSQEIEDATKPLSVLPALNSLTKIGSGQEVEYAYRVRLGRLAAGSMIGIIKLADIWDNWEDSQNLDETRRDKWRGPWKVYFRCLCAAYVFNGDPVLHATLKFVAERCEDLGTPPHCRPTELDWHNAYNMG